MILNAVVLAVRLRRQMVQVTVESHTAGRFPSCQTWRWTFGLGAVVCLLVFIIVHALLLVTTVLLPKRESLRGHNIFFQLVCWHIRKLCNKILDFKTTGTRDHVSQ